jgi:hypothetical protein
MFYRKASAASRRMVTPTADSVELMLNATTRTAGVSPASGNEFTQSPLESDAVAFNEAGETPAVPVGTGPSKTLIKISSD